MFKFKKTKEDKSVEGKPGPVAEQSPFGDGSDGEGTEDTIDPTAVNVGQALPAKKKITTIILVIVSLLMVLIMVAVITFLLLGGGKKKQMKPKPKPNVTGVSPAITPVGVNTSGGAGETILPGSGIVSPISPIEAIKEPPKNGATISPLTPISPVVSPIQAPVQATQEKTPAAKTLPVASSAQVNLNKQEKKQIKSEISVEKDMEKKRNAARELGLKSTSNPFKEKYLAKFKGEGKAVTGKRKQAGEQDIEKLLDEFKTPTSGSPGYQIPVSIPSPPPPPPPVLKLTVYGVVVGKNSRDSVALTDHGELMVGRKINDINTVTAITFLGVEVSGAGFFAVNAKQPAEALLSR